MTLSWAMISQVGHLKQSQKAKRHKWDHVNLKNFCGAKKTVNRVKGQPAEWEKTFANHRPDGGAQLQDTQLTPTAINKGLE